MHQFFTGNEALAGCIPGVLGSAQPLSNGASLSSPDKPVVLSAFYMIHRGETSGNKSQIQ